LVGVKVTDDLPFPTMGPIFQSDAYWALQYDAAGKWYVLRGDGEVFNGDSVIAPFVDLPGGGSDDPNGPYRDLRVTGTDTFFARRSDGSVFDKDSSKLFEMANTDYRHIAISDTAPDLTSFKNPKPVEAIYKTRAIENVPVVVPIITSDIEKLPADL